MLALRIVSQGPLTSVAAKMDNGVYPLADCERRGHVCNIGLHECLALRRCKWLLVGKPQLVFASKLPPKLASNISRRTCDQNRFHLGLGRAHATRNRSESTRLKLMHEGVVGGLLCPFDIALTTCRLRGALVIWKVINAARLSGWVKAAVALCVIAICIGSLLPETERVPTGLPFGKLEHFLAYRDRTFAWTRDVKQEGSDLGGTEFSLARLPPGVLAAMERGTPPAGERCGGRRKQVYRPMACA